MAALQYVLSALDAFAHEACEIVRQGAWTIQQIEKEVDAFLLVATQAAQRECDEIGIHISDMVAQQPSGFFAGLVRPTKPVIRTKIWRMLKRSPEWRKYQNELLEVAEIQTASATPSPPSDEKRRGYRVEVKQWMGRTGMENLEQAAKRLAISKSTLKSIMSDKGTLRYSSDTLQRVLKQIGHRNPGQKEG